MSKPKKYFNDSHDEFCRTEADWRVIYADQPGAAIDLHEAKPDRNEEYRWCSELDLPVLPGDCGKACEFYKPINGRSGKCTAKTYCYEPTGKVKTITI